MIRAALYARFSSDNQREESITAQFRDGEDYCQKLGYIVVAHYADEAKSGTTTAGRDQYKKMLADAKAKKFDIIIFHKIDRNARNEFDYYMTKKKLEDAGCLYAYSKQDINTTTPEGQMMESIMAGFAAYYSRNLSCEIKKGLRENAYEGKITGGRPAYGYAVDDNKKYYINEKEAPAVRMMYQGYADGLTYHQILQNVYTAGFRTRSGKSFSMTALYEILRNPKYKGTVIVGRAAKTSNGKNYHALNPNAIIVDDAIPPIIEKTLWEKVNMKLDDNKKRTGAFTAKHVYLLSGLVYCGICGRPMNGHSTCKAHTHHKNFYYRCPTPRDISPKCKQTLLNADVIENFLIELMKNYFLDIDRENAIKLKVREEIEKSESPDWEGKLKKLRQLKGQSDEQYNRLLDLYIDGKLEKDKTVEKLQAIEESQKTLDRQIKEAEDHLLIGQLTEDKVNKTMALLKKSLTQKQDPEFFKALFSIVIRRVTVYEDRVVVSLLVSQVMKQPRTRLISISVNKEYMRDLFYHVCCAQ